MLARSQGGIFMKFSYSAVWQDVVALARSHGALIAAVAGVFIFLPALLFGYLLPAPEPTDPSQLVPMMAEYFAANWHWMLLQGLFAMLGSIAIFRLIFSRAGTSVGAAIAGALPLLVSYFVAAVLSGFIMGLGMLLLIVPGLYLFGRLAPLGALLVAEDQRNPLTAISRTFALTKGNGWAILGLALVVAIAALVVMLVINSIFGIVLILIAGQELGGLLVLIVTTLTSSALTVLFILLYAALYRRLSPTESAAAAFN
jgi:hypothetical protein